MIFDIALSFLPLFFHPICNTSLCHGNSTGWSPAPGGGRENLIADTSARSINCKHALNIEKVVLQRRKVAFADYNFGSSAS
jgi:hypothetical protein